MEVDDAAFELTSADMARMARTRQDKQAKPAFKTKWMREQEREKRLAKVTHVPVRVTFPDQSWLQARFGASESLAEVYAFVRSNLAAPRAFYLYSTSPPQRVP